jgi:transcriptional regulator with XRE-family HTH domain
MPFDDLSFGMQLRSVREERGLRQWELACDLGVAPRHVSDWETGRVDPKLTTLRRLAAALDVDAARLLGSEGSDGAR